MRYEEIAIPQCKICDKSPLTTVADLVQLALWPLNPRGTMFVDFSFMFYISVLQHFSPPLSMGAMLETLKFITSLNGIVSDIL